MHFDNAFRTANGKIGMQFVSKGTVLSVYEDKKGTLITSDCDDVMKAELIRRYKARVIFYQPSKGKKHA